MRTLLKTAWLIGFDGQSPSEVCLPVISLLHELQAAPAGQRGLVRHRSSNDTVGGRPSAMLTSGCPLLRAGFRATRPSRECGVVPRRWNASIQIADARASAEPARTRRWQPSGVWPSFENGRLRATQADSEHLPTTLASHRVRQWASREADFQAASSFRSAWSIPQCRQAMPAIPESPVDGGPHMVSA